jgi:hypothetical protein
MLAFPGLIPAEQKYTYIKASLGYPWFMFFVFLVLVAIPFVLIIILSWRNKRRENDRLAPHEP